MASYDLPEPSSVGMSDTRSLPDMPPVEGRVSYKTPPASAAPALPRLDVGSNPVAARIRELALKESGGDEAFADLVTRIARQESSFNRDAVGPKTEKWGSARGTLQLIEAKFRENGGKDFDNADERDATGVRLLWKNWQRFGGNPAHVAAAHHAGEGAVEKAGGVPGTYDKAAGIGTPRYVAQVLGQDVADGGGPLAPQQTTGGGARGRWRPPPIEGNVAYPEPEAPAAAGGRGAGTAALDLGKDAAAGAVTGVGNAIRGLGEKAAGNLLRDFSSMSIGFMLAERLGMVNKPEVKANPLEAPAGAVERTGKAIEASVSPQGRQAKKDSTPTGDLFDPSTWSFGKDPSLAGYGQLAANTFGQFLPQLLTRWLPATGVTFGTMQGAGAAASEAREFIAQQPHEKLLEASPRYRELVETGRDEAQARAILSREAEKLAADLTAPVSALGGIATERILNGAGGRWLGGQVASLPGVGGRVARGATTGLLSGLEESGQEVAEGMATRAGINAATGMQNSITEGSFGNAVQGFMGGGGPGVASGLMTGPQAPGAPAARAWR